MADTGWLKEVLEEVKHEVDTWPNWMRERNYNEGSYGVSEALSAVGEKGIPMAAADAEENE